MEGKEAVKEVNKFIDKATRCPTCKRKYGDITISRVPSKTKDEFMTWCKEELSNDYGMGLKFCFDSMIELKKLKSLLYDKKV